VSEADAWRAVRRIVAHRDGYRCCYCGVPTAATLEHVEARASGGENRYANYRLACPSCNSRKGDEPLASWQARQGWQLPDQPIEASSVACLVRSVYGQEGPIVATGSTNARLRLEAHDTLVEVRASREDQWQRFRLGRGDHAAVIAAAADFLRRHHTPQPKRRGPHNAAKAPRRRSPTRPG
jgi:hypothetical protein